MTEFASLPPSLRDLITTFTACEDENTVTEGNCAPFITDHPIFEHYPGLSTPWKAAFQLWFAMNPSLLPAPRKLHTQNEPMELIIHLLKGPSSSPQKLEHLTKAHAFLGALETVRHPLAQPVRACLAQATGWEECFAAMLVKHAELSGNFHAQARYEALQARAPSQPLVNGRAASRFGDQSLPRHHTGDLLVFFGLLALSRPESPFQ